MTGFTYDPSKQRQEPTCSRVIATTECSCGNDTVGDAWKETASFPIEMPIYDILLWVAKMGGANLMISLDRSTEIKP
jgi:hypothetical protein